MTTKGVKEHKGRAKGTPNKKTIWNVPDFLEARGYDLIQEIMDTLTTVDDVEIKLKYQCVLLEYCAAKKKAVEITVEEKAPVSMEVLDAIIPEGKIADVLKLA